ncbi:MAG: glycosyltransferase [Patescibacteria group bacterium]
MKKLTIIMLGMSSQAEWDQGILNKKMQTVQAGAVNRNFHILQQILKRPEVVRVIHVDFLPFTKRKVIKEALQAKLWRSTSNTQARGLTWRVDSKSPKWWSLACLRWQDVKHLKPFIPPDTEVVIWSYHPFFPQVFDLFPYAKKVFDSVDNWAEHPVYAPVKERLKKNYQHIQDQADIIFTVSPDLQNLFAGHQNVTWIPNGVDVDHFSREASNPEQFSTLPRPFVVYIGVIQERLDVELLEQTARLIPSIQIVLAGPVWAGTPLGGLRELKNVMFLGPVPYQDLPNLLSQASAGIIPHRVNRFTASMNPLKLYEYLASGLPVISTPVQGTEQFASGVRVATTSTEFAAAIQQAISLPTPEKQKLKLLVQNQTWDQRIDQMIKIIQRSCPH